MWEVLKFVFVAKKPEEFFLNNSFPIFSSLLYPCHRYPISIMLLLHNILGLTQIFFFSKKDSIMYYSEFILCIMPSWKEKQNYCIRSSLRVTHHLYMFQTLWSELSRYGGVFPETSNPWYWHVCCIYNWSGLVHWVLVSKQLHLYLRIT